MSEKEQCQENYEFLDLIGIGSFGSVHKAKNKSTNKIVAIKVMKEKFKNKADCGKLTEYKMLTGMSNHPNIVQLYNTFLASSNELYFVMEYMDLGNLYQLINERKRLSSSIEIHEIRSILYQLLDALSHIHYHEQIFHRDIKPENLLLSYSGDNKLILKLADFGLAKYLDNKPPFTDYVSTRWYRAPEVLLKSTTYSYPIDLWAVGAIFAELITLEPLFPGQSEIDQIHCICKILGSPGTLVKKKKSRIDLLSSVVYSPPSSIVGLGGEWKEGAKLAKKLGFEFPLSPAPTSPFSHILKTSDISLEAINLLTSLLKFDPCKRINSKNALSHPFLLGKSKPEEFNLPDIPPVSPLLMDESRPFDLKITPKDNLLTRTISSPIIYKDHKESRLTRRSISNLSIELHRTEKLSAFHKLNLWARKYGLASDKSF